MENRVASKPIGVFDSGVGGLTVLSALKDLLPNEDFIYLGDTARLPYGTKSASTVVSYAKQCVNSLWQHDIKYCVIACNTASSVAVDSLREQLPQLPIMGVVEPGAKAIANTIKEGRALVLATDSTTKWHAYKKQVATIAPKIEVVEWACPLFVSLAEEGWTKGPLVEQIIAKVLDGVKDEPFNCVTLGCTHFPMLKQAIANVMSGVPIIDSASVVAKALKSSLEDKQLLNPQSKGKIQFLATDSIDRFRLMASRFMGVDLSHDEVVLVHSLAQVEASASAKG